MKSSVGKLAPRCQLGSTNNLTKNSGIGWARSVSADFIKNASVNQFTLAPLNKTARNNWHYCVVGSFAGISKRKQTASSEGKRRQARQAQPSVSRNYTRIPTPATKCVALNWLNPQKNKRGVNLACLQLKNLTIYITRFAAYITRSATYSPKAFKPSETSYV